MGGIDMAIKCINPATGERLQSFEAWTNGRIEQALGQAEAAAPPWDAIGLEARCRHILALAERLRAQSEECARLISLEMGKLLREARAEVAKCATLCDYYAEHAAAFLADEHVGSEAGSSYVCFQPLGTVLGIMPWNFPFWQVFRFAVPALIAGNTGLLKHAPNVMGCAMKIEALFREAGLPEGVFQNLPIEVEAVAGVIADRRVHAVTLTGSGRAGSQVAAQAGAALKKTVLELGGSDAFIVLDDADLGEASEWAARARFQANGQSCIAAKRFIVAEPVAEEFVARFRALAEARVPGDPLDENSGLGPVARADLREALHAQVRDALAHGARAVTGGELPSGAGFFYPPSILDGVTPEMRAWREELFGPVASIIRVSGDDEALRIANDSPFGLGGSVWTGDTDRGEHLARRLQSGSAFVNAMVRSDPGLPFGGIKQSGYGRELAGFGIREFVNVKTVWIR
jgi:succinate-semialdehyde dehydrogenase/glutarate-semialdehyde dehydrogenase